MHLNDFLGQFLLCSNIHIASKYIDTLEDVVVSYLPQTDTDTFFWKFFAICWCTASNLSSNQVAWKNGFRNE